MKKFWFLLLMHFSLMASSQELPLKMQEQLENRENDLQEEVQDDDDLLQQLDDLRRHPVNINSANKEDLLQFRFLTGIQINSLINYRDLLGKLVSIYELQAVPGWDVATIKKILPFIYVGPSQTLKENLTSRFKGEHSLLLRFSRIMEKSAGYLTDSGTHYLGDPNHLLLRYRYQYKDLFYFGLVGDKDAGEQFFKGVQSKGFDFYSVHLFARRLGLIKAIALGDFTVNLGQGLIQWQSAGFGKSSEVVGVKKQSSALMPYRAAGEYNFYRGIGISLQKGHWEATGFLSCKKLSGNIIDDTSGRVSSFQTSGYHRTDAENKDRDVISEIAAGGCIEYHKRFFSIALNSTQHHFNHVLQKDDQPYNKFAFSGSKIFNSSIDYSYTKKNTHLFGEIAVDKNKNNAIVQGVVLSIDPKVDVSFLFRDISRAYQSLNGSAFTESSSPSNERGIYSGISIRPMKGWTLNAYADFYRFPWLRYRLNGPSGGADYLLMLLYQPDKQTEIFARYRSERKYSNEPGERQVKRLEGQSRQSLRIHLSTNLNSAFLFRTRVELIWYERPGNRQQGFLGYMEAIMKPGRRFKTIARFQYVETGGYDSRIYVYETDMLYSFSIPAYYDKGLRYYLVVGYEPFKKLSCWLRLGQVYNLDKEDFGSGSELIQSKKKTELKTEFVWRL